MDIFYTKEEAEFRQQVRDFLRQELIPLLPALEQQERIPRGFLERLGEKGYIGLMYPREVGGQGKGLIQESIVDEELAYLNLPIATTRSVAGVFCGAPIFRFGTQEQRRKYLAPVLRGEAIASIAISEPAAGSDAAGMKTRAVKEGDFYIVNGQKRFITNSNIADFLVLFAITNPEVHPHQGMSAFIVETGTPGFKIARDIPTLGSRLLHHPLLEFKDMAVPASNLLGKEGQGFQILTDELASERIDIASRAYGGARRCYEEAVRFSATREQFDRKIRQFEGVSFKIAEMKVDLDAAQLLILRAARAYDQGLKVEEEAAIAKLFTTQKAFEVADKAMQVLGGIGYSSLTVVEQMFREIRSFRFGGGTDEIMKFLIQREEYRAFGY